MFLDLQRLNFIIIEQVTNEVFLAFSPKEILLNTTSF